MCDCGLRAGEITRIKTKDIQQNQITVHGKGNKERLVFISSALRKILKKYERIRKQHFNNKETDDSYFLNYKAETLSTVSIYNIVVNAVQKAQIKTDKRISPHMFRHFYATQSLKAGVDIYTLSRLLGHSDISTTQIYLRSLTDDDLSVQAIKSSPLMNLNKK
jgi:integrase/recombinase XerD